MSNTKELATSTNILEKELTAEQIQTICDMRSTGHSLNEIRDYVYISSNKHYSEHTFSTFFRQNLINKNDFEMRNQLTVHEKLRRLEKYRRSDYVANVIEKTITGLDDEFSDLKSKEKIQAIVDLTKIMLETISKEAYAAAANGESIGKNSANVQINLNETMSKIAKEKSDLKKDILSSAKYETEPKNIEVEIVKGASNDKSEE